MSEERLHGILVTWLPERFFGFLRPDGADKDMFCGMAAFRQNDIEPQIDERYSFVVGYDDRGRPRATDILHEGAEAAAERVFNAPKHPPVRM